MKNNRLGIVLVVSTIAIIVLIVGLLLQRQHSAQQAHVRIQGLGMLRSLAALPVAALAPAGNQPGVLNSIFAYRDSPDFAYAVISAAGKGDIAEVVSPGVLVPHAASHPDPGGLAERTVATAQNARRIREFYGPLATTDGRQLQVRIGYFHPDSLLSMKDLPFYALIALAVFLLVPLIHLLIKREMAPLATLGEQLRTMATAQLLPAAPIDPTHDVRSLVLRLHAYLDGANLRVRELEQTAVANLANGRLIEYGSNKMQTVLQNLPDGLIVLDPAGEVTFASGKVEHLLGVGVDDVRFQPVEAWCKDPELAAMLARFRSTGLDTRRPVTIEFSPVQVPHKRLWATAQPLCGEAAGMVLGTLVVLHDATREHLARQAGNDFVAHVSHELKSPLNVIGMYSEMLEDAGDEPALRVEAINVIRDEVERMTSLVNNLLNVSKLEMGNMRPERHRVKLEDMLRDAHQQALTRADARNISLTLDVPRDIAAVAIDKDLFRISLNNLLNNAIKYNSAGGNVVLSAEEGDTDVVISVRDSGIGMAPEDQARVLEKFYRVRETGPEQRGGHGLGLYLANQIIELHHGRLTLESELGRGSVFSIHLKKMPELVDGANVL